jgi:hypothetical protein
LGASAELRITEVWPGGLDGDENTSDWIEVTNFGTSAINNLSDYHFRNSPVPEGVPAGLPLQGGQFTGVTSLDPGESAVFLVAWEAVLGFNPSPTLSESIDAFEAMWGVTAGVDLKLGYMLDADGEGGPGLSREGDSVLIYDGSFTGAALVDEVSFPTSDRASYIYDPATQSFGDLAEVGVLGAREGLLAGSDLTTLPPIGSPGVVPEPGSAVLFCLPVAGLLFRRSRRHCQQTQKQPDLAF